MVPLASLLTESTESYRKSKQPQYCVLTNDALKNWTAFTCLGIEDSLRNNALFLRTLIFTIPNI